MSQAITTKYLGPTDRKGDGPQLPPGRTDQAQERSRVQVVAMTTLWKHNSTTGYWALCRQCSAEEAQQWLAIFQKDEPHAWFKLSSRRPSACPNRRMP